jgi:hypothetical protein
MKLRHGLAGFVIVASLLPGWRAFARTPPSDSSDEPQETNKDTNNETAKPPAPADAEPANLAAPAVPGAPSEPAESSAPAASEAYVPFAPPPSPLRIENPNASVQFGVLAQPMLEVAGGPDADLTTKNLFLRRFRFIFGGTVFKYFEFFFDTDYPNLFKQDSAETMAGTYKNAPGLNVQDAYVTFKPAGDLIKVDAGFMLPPLSHNALESAAKLYGEDYFVNSFRRNIFSNVDPFGSAAQSPAGRDVGVQVRGLILGGHLELRVGAFQGLRLNPVPASTGVTAEVGGFNIFRIAARVQVNVLDAEPGYFYQGTYLGTKKVLSFGGFYDFQDQYKYFGGDMFLDLPIGRAGVLTAQADVVRWDGGTSITTLSKDTAVMAEAGFLIGPIMLSPIVRFEHLVAAQVPNPDPTMPGTVPDPNNPSEDRYGGGLAFWPYGHNTNLKLFGAHVHRNPAPHDFNQINLQWQLYFY